MNDTSYGDTTAAGSAGIVWKPRALSKGRKNGKDIAMWSEWVKDINSKTARHRDWKRGILYCPCKVNQFLKVLNHGTGCGEQWNLILLCGALLCRGTRRSACRLRSSSQAVSVWVFALHPGLQNGGSAVATETRELVTMNIINAKHFELITNYSFALYWIVFIITFD